MNGFLPSWYSIVDFNWRYWCQSRQIVNQKTIDLLVHIYKMRIVPDFNNSSIKVMHINGRLLANDINWVMLGFVI